MRFVDILVCLCYNLLQKRCFGSDGIHDGIRLIFPHRMGVRYFGRDAYTMSHECVHQIIYRLACVNGLCEHRWVSWIEELIAECCAVAFLKYAGENWSKCRLSERDFEYQFDVQKYLRDLILDSKRSKNGVLLTCPTYESLLNADAGFCDHRDWHAREVLDLFDRFDISCLPGLFAYIRYVNFDTKLLDVDAYLRDYFGNKMVEYLCGLQTAICDGSNLRSLQE